MLQHFNLRSVLFASMLIAGISSCSEDDESTVTPPTTELRTKIDYAKVTPTTPYKSLFIDTKGDTTADLTTGNARYKMFQALNYYMGSAVRDSTQVSATTMANMYANTGNP